MFKHKILLPDGTVLTSGTGTTNAIRSVKLTEQVSDQDDLAPGAACAACAELELWVPENRLQITQGDVLTLYRVDSTTGSEEQVGIFLAEKPVKSSANVYKVTAYDRMILLDKDLSPWLREQQSAFPVALTDFIRAVCNQCGVTLEDDALTDLPNASYQIQAFYADNLTGRQLIQWAAQAAGRFARMTPAGKLTFGWFTSQGLTLTPQQYLQGSLQYEDYETAAIDKVQIRQSDSDVGVIYPPDTASDNALVLQGNLLLTAENAEQIRPIAQSLYTLLQGFRYTPLSVSLHAGADIPSPGTIVKFLDAHNRQLTTCVMQRCISGQKVTLTATGNARRDSTTAVNRSKLENLNGKMLEIQADIGQLTIKASDLSGNYSQLKQSVDSLELGITAQNLFADILGDAVWTEFHANASAQDGVLTLNGGSEEAWASLYVPEQKLLGLAGKRIRITLEYRVLQTVGGAACRNTLWYVYKTQSGGGYYINTITTGNDVPASDQWHKVSWEITLKQDVVTKLQLTSNLGAGGHGSIAFRNVTFSAEGGVQSTLSLSKDGVQISAAGLGELATKKDFTALQLDQENLSLTVVKDGEVRSAFAADESSVTIQSGRITFTSNTLVVDSDNFHLDESGNVSITGQFHATDGTSRVDIQDGLFRIWRKLGDGSYKEAVTIASSGSNASIGNLYLLGPKAGGGQTYNVTAFSGYSGGNFNVYNASGISRFQVVINGNGDAEVWINGSKKF